MANLQEIIPAFFTGPNGQQLTPEQIAQRQQIAQSLLGRATDTRPDAGGWASVLTKGLLGYQSGAGQRAADAAIVKNAEQSQNDIAALLGGGAGYSDPVALGVSPTSAVATGTPVSVPTNFNIGENQDAIRNGIIETAQAIGADPLDLATAISYETGGTFNPTKAGPTTQYGQHRGFIQFGEPQARQHGVDWSNPIGSQLGANGAVANYFRSSGFKPGMSGLDLYSTINAGSPGRYNASDANNGGAPGSVADKWNNQMAGHRAKAQALLGSGSSHIQNMPYKPQAVSGSAVQNIPYSPQQANGPALTPLAAIEQIAPVQDTDGLFAPGAQVSQADLEFARQASGQEVVPNSNFNDRWNAGFLPDGSNLRPFRPGEQINNPDGSYSTELTTTWQLPDGQFVNVPSLWMGANGPVRFNPEDEQGIMGAMQQYEFGNAQAFPRYMSVQEAEAVARQRSRSGGAGSVNIQTPSPSVARALIPQQETRPSESLLAQNDMMLGGALSPSGSSPVAQALSGYFPDAPGATPQGSNNQTATIARILGSPYASNEAKQLAMGMYQRQIDANDPMKQAQLQLTQAQTQAALRKANNPNADETYFGNPVAIQNKDGTISYGQIGNRGSFKPIQLGEGQTFAPPTKTIDTGTEVIMTDQAGNVISRTAKQNREAAAETAGGTVEGKTEAEKRLAAPGDIQAAQTALDVLNQIENHPGLSLGTGITSVANRIPGTSGYDFQNLVEQAKSGAFLSAIQQLRGMGSLSNAEGAAATAAVNRMDTATSKEAFLNAVRDYKKIVQNGMDRANKSAGNSQPSGKRTSTGVTWSVE